MVFLKSQWHFYPVLATYKVCYGICWSMQAACREQWHSFFLQWLLPYWNSAWIQVWLYGVSLAVMNPKGEIFLSWRCINGMASTCIHTLMVPSLSLLAIWWSFAQSSVNCDNISIYEACIPARNVPLSSPNPDSLLSTAPQWDGMREHGWTVERDREM